MIYGLPLPHERSSKGSCITVVTFLWYVLMNDTKHIRLIDRIKELSRFILFNAPNFEAIFLAYVHRTSTSTLRSRY